MMNLSPLPPSGKYRGKPIQYPSTINLTATANSKLRGDLSKSPTAEMAKNDTAYNVNDIPKWVWEQRNSWHGVDFMYNGRVDFDDFITGIAKHCLRWTKAYATIRRSLKNSVC
jgi:N-acetylglucosamine-6-sulfatase